MIGGQFVHKLLGFQPEGLGALSPGQAASAPPWVHGLQPGSLKGCEPSVGNDGSQPFRLKSYYVCYPGRRRKASLPWAECSQTFSLKSQRLLVKWPNLPPTFVTPTLHDRDRYFQLGSYQRDFAYFVMVAAGRSGAGVRSIKRVPMIPVAKLRVAINPTTASNRK